MQAVAAELLSRGISGQELSKLEDSWLPLLEPFPWGIKQSDGLKLRGRILFGLGAKLLGQDAAQAEPVGAFWSLADGAQHCSDPPSRDVLAREAQAILAALRGRLPSQLRPLTILSALAAADLIRQGNGLARLSAAVRHRLVGTLPR